MKSKTTTKKTTSSAPIIYPDGLYRFAAFKPLIGYSRETWRQRGKEGTAPKPVVQGANSTLWRGADVLAWLENPAEYKAPKSDTAY